MHRLAVEATNVVETLREEQKTQNWRATLYNNPQLAPVVQWIESQVDVNEELDRAVEAITNRFSRLVSGSVWAMIQILMTLFTLYFFFRDRRAVLRSMRSLVPLSHAEADKVFRRVADTIYGTLYGHIAVSFIQGALGGLMFWVLGLPAPLLWGVVMALLAIIPVLGAFVIWAPAAAFLLMEGDVWKAVILTLWGTLVVGLIDNLLYPVLVGKRLRLHTLPVFFAIVGGLIVFGMAGLVLGPLALALTIALVDIWKRRTADGRTAEEALESA
jgi:predicted PurR-regulated permease PerM